MIRWLNQHSIAWHNVGAALLVVLCLLLLFLGSLWQLLQQQEGDGWLSILREPYVRHIVLFGFYQASLSALLSVFLAIPVAHALYYQTFWGKTSLLKLFSLTIVLPVLVVIFGLLGVYGSVGWLAKLLAFFGYSQAFNIYGLSGILMAHVFFNLPLASKVFLNALQAIPHQQRQLAAQLGVLNWHFIRLIEWRYLRRQLLPTLALVFMLCFTSFTIVLTLGGGPKYTTLEVAIYQAVIFDFELGRAAVFALLQFLFCFILFHLSHYFSQQTPTTANVGESYHLSFCRSIQWLQRGVLVLLLVYILPPLLHVLFSSLNWQAWRQSLANPELWKALLYSLTIAPAAGLLSLVLTVMLLLGARRLNWLGYRQTAAHLLNVGMMILAVPTLVLAVGLFLWLRQFELGTPVLFFIVVLCNALMAMPFALRILTLPFYNNMIYYEKLCQSLGIFGVSRWRLIEWQRLKNPLRSAFALASALSLGDFTAIALFGQRDFTSLPRLLYQQLGHYRSQEAAVTACLLLLFCAAIFYLIEKRVDDYSG